MSSTLKDIVFDDEPVNVPPLTPNEAEQKIVVEPAASPVIIALTLCVSVALEVDEKTLDSAKPVVVAPTVLDMLTYVSPAVVLFVIRPWK
jgi:hypothetical protein